MSELALDDMMFDPGQADREVRSLALVSVEIETMRHLVDALAALQKASIATNDGLAADNCENACQSIRAALRMVGAQ